jgi:hypothetical protein
MKTPWVAMYYICGKTYTETAVNEPRLDEDGENLLHSHRDSALPKVLSYGDMMLPMHIQLSAQLGSRREH